MGHHLGQDVKAKRIIILTHMLAPVLLAEHAAYGPSQLLQTQSSRISRSHCMMLAEAVYKCHDCLHDAHALSPACSCLASLLHA